MLSSFNRSNQHTPAPDTSRIDYQMHLSSGTIPATQSYSFILKLKTMSGRGDNNKHGASGRGATNQSNQPFVADGEKESRSNHNMTGSNAEPSIEQKKEKASDAHRDTGNANANPRSVKTTQARTFNLLVDDVPYIVTASPFSFNEDIRYHVSVNGSTEHVFTWDSELKMIRAIDDDTAELPGSLEEAISERLQSKE